MKFLKEFFYNYLILIKRIFFLWETMCSVWMDRRDKANSSLSHFRDTPKNQSRVQTVPYIVLSGTYRN